MKSADKNRIGNAGRMHAAQPAGPRRPWPLIALGVTGFAWVLIVGLDRAQRRDTGAKPEQKSYSSVAESFEPMAVASRQAGKPEPLGVASPLQLFAVRPGRTPREGIAILGADEASSRTYVAGALFANGARLAELYSDHVVLVRGTKRYALYLPKKGRSDQLKAGGDVLMTGDFPVPRPPPAAPPVRISDAVRVAPVYDGTQISGYAVYPGSHAAQFARWGFRAGDVLVSLGGQPLTSSAQMESLLDQLAQGVTLTGEVLRREARITVTLDGGALLAAASSGPASPIP